jgi:hypothetical protein
VVAAWVRGQLAAVVAATIVQGAVLLGQPKPVAGTQFVHKQPAS